MKLSRIVKPAAWAVDLDSVVRLRDERNKLIVAGDEFRRQQKETSSKIPKASADERPQLIENGKQLRTQISETEARQKLVEAELRGTPGSDSQYDASGRSGRRRKMTPAKFT